jgi:phosphoribosylanthranilate isomerase
MLSDRLSVMQAVPLEIRRAFREKEEPVCPEQALLQETCARATADALGFVSESEPSQRNKHIQEAREWFSNTEEGWAETCFDLAGILFEPVRDAVLATEPAKKQTRRRSSKT